MKLYLVKTTKAQMMAEQCVNVMLSAPTNTAYYEYEVLDEVDVKLPEGYTLHENDYGPFFTDPRGADADLVTEAIGWGGFRARLVSANGTTDLYTWSKSWSFNEPDDYTK